MLPMLADKNVRELLDAFASSDPTPGGGSASALASALGAALLQMVAALPKTRSNSDADRAALTAAATGARARKQDRLCRGGERAPPAGCPAPGPAAAGRPAPPPPPLRRRAEA